MRTLRQNGVEAFTRTELLVVVAVIVAIAAAVLTGLERAQQKRWRIQCADNLRQIGWAFGNFASDHNGAFPAQVYTKIIEKAGGKGTVEACRIFQVMSNEMSTPHVLICPADKRVRAGGLGAVFSNTNLSYFVGLDAVETHPSMFLCGDRNIINGLPVENGILVLATNRPFSWTPELHNGQVNVGLADGSVHQFVSGRLIGGTGERLAMP